MTVATGTGPCRRCGRSKYTPNPEVHPICLYCDRKGCGSCGTRLITGFEQACPKCGRDVPLTRKA